MIYEYKTSGVCSQKITIDIDEQNIIQSLDFLGGCSGNLQGIAALVKGKNAKEVIPILNGITCGHKKSSCPNELSLALKQILDKK